MFKRRCREWKVGKDVKEKVQRVDGRERCLKEGAGSGR